MNFFSSSVSTERYIKVKKVFRWEAKKGVNLRHIMNKKYSFGHKKEKNEVTSIGSNAFWISYDGVSSYVTLKFIN